MNQLTERELQEVKTQLEQVESYGTDFALGWLRGAFYSHKEREKHFKAEIAEFRLLLLAATGRRLTVREAQLCNVCRICRQGPGAPFVLNYGKEFAHPGCLELEKQLSVVVLSPTL